MTKKDYLTLVRAIQAWRLYEQPTVETLIECLSFELWRDNLSFDPERFKAACLDPLPPIPEVRPAPPINPGA